MKKLVILPGLRDTSEAVASYTDALEGAVCASLQGSPDRNNYAEWNNTMNGAVTEIHNTIKGAALGTVMEERTRTGPDWVKRRTTST